MAEIISMEDAKKFAEEMRKVDWSNPLERRAVAQIIVKQLRDEQDKQDISRILGVTQETFKEGDTMQFVTRKGGKAYVHAPGSAAPRSTITNRVQTLEAENVSVDLEFQLDQLRQGRYGSMNEVRQTARQELEYRKWKIMWDTLRGSVSATHDNYNTVDDAATSATKAAALDAVIDLVEDEVGGASAIIGRRSDLNWLLKWGSSNGMDYSDNTKDQILRTGRLGTYRGLAVVPLNSWQDGYGAEVIATGELMVLNPTTLKIGVTKSQDVFDDFDPHARIWSVVLNEMYGCGVFFPERNGKLVFT